MTEQMQSCFPERQLRVNIRYEFRRLCCSDRDDVWRFLDRWRERKGDEVEEHLDYDMILRKAGEHRLKSASSALANATVTTANNLRAKCIVTPTVSGATARVVSKFKPKTGIIGISPDEATLRRMQINWGVMPLKSVAVYTTEDICDTAIDLICAKKLAEAGDMVVLTLGIPSTNVSENRTVSNMMRIAMVDDRK